MSLLGGTGGPADEGRSGLFRRARRPGIPWPGLAIADPSSAAARPRQLPGHAAPAGISIDLIAH